MSEFDILVGSIKISVYYRASYTELLKVEICNFLKQCAEGISQNHGWDINDLSRSSPDPRIIELNGILQTIVNTAELKISQTSTPASSPQGSLPAASPRSSSSRSPRSSFKHFAFTDLRAVDDYNNNVLNKYHDSFREIAGRLASITSPDIKRLRNGSM